MGVKVVFLPDCHLVLSLLKHKRIVLVGVKVVFLPDCHLVLSLLKHKRIWVFFNKKNKKFKLEKPLK